MKDEGFGGVGCMSACTSVGAARTRVADIFPLAHANRDVALRALTAYKPRRAFIFTAKPGVQGLQQYYCSRLRPPGV